MPNTSEFNQTEFNAWPAQPTSPAVSDDADFLEGLIHVCVVEWDANADGGTTDEEGDRKEDWRQVEGLEDVRCRITIRRPKDIQLGDRPSATMEWKVLLGQEFVVDRRNRIVWIDRSTGLARYGYVIGRVLARYDENPDKPHHWSVECYENPI